MPTLTIPKPNPKQELFFRDKHRYVAFGGARGGGKSWAVRKKAELLALNYPGIKIMIVRRTYPELSENHILPMCEDLHCNAEDRADRIASYNDARKCITFPNNSRILYRYCENDKDAERFQGSEVDILFVDEATHQSEERVKKLNACVRGVNNFPKRTYYTCNPGGEGHQWVKRLFIDRNFTLAENPEDYSFIQSLVGDNTALMATNPDYVAQLQSLPEYLRRAWLEGDWNVYEGQFFEEFRDVPEHYLDGKFTHVIEPFEIPTDWLIYRSFDFGYSKPFSCAWWAVDYDGRLYRILELYGCAKTPNEGLKWNPEKIFSEIARIENEHRWLNGKNIIGVADPSIWDASRGEAIIEAADRNGVYFNKGDNTRLPGWMQVHYRLQFDDNGIPDMYIFNTCKGFIRTMPLLQYSTTQPEDLDTTQEDHIADEVRYLCMARPITPTKAIEQQPIQDDPLDLLKADTHRYRRYSYY